MIKEPQIIVAQAATITSETIEGIETPVGINAEYVGQDKAPDGWEYFAWDVELAYKGRVISTEYKMGLAHVSKQGPGKRRYHHDWQGYVDTYAPTPPSVKDVIHSLLMDGSALDMGFEDWASDYGYDSDSRKALTLYLECQDAGRKIVRLLGPDIDAFRTALEDY